MSVFSTRIDAQRLSSTEENDTYATFVPVVAQLWCGVDTISLLQVEQIYYVIKSENTSCNIK